MWVIVLVVIRHGIKRALLLHCMLENDENYKHYPLSLALKCVQVLTKV